MRNRGFGSRWCSWICGLLSTASSSVLINGETSELFTLASAVRQGDPLSPALFILAMDSLQAMMNWVTRHNLLAPLGFNRRTPRASIFADDAVLFFRPEAADMQVIYAIWSFLGRHLACASTFRRARSRVFDVKRFWLYRWLNTSNANVKIFLSNTWGCHCRSSGLGDMIFFLLSTSTQAK